MWKLFIKDIYGKRNIEIKDYKLEDYKVKIIIKKIVSNHFKKENNYDYPFEIDVNYNESYKKIIMAKVNQTGFTLNCGIQFIDNVNRHEDGDYHYITFNYGLDYPDDDAIVNDILEKIENYLEEVKNSNTDSVKEVY